ncbi:MAG: DUF2202 domain-containing protein [Planctomycetales bacterium]|nr:DUF2202 domain-containing protein [Planctomycetales bacterium]
MFSYKKIRNRHESRTTFEALERKDLLASDVVLSAAEQANLVFMREEEKLARDVYLELAEQYDNGTFANIAESESRHMQSVLNLLDRYGIEDPVVNDEPGEFTNAIFAQMYNDLVEKGAQDLLSAYEVGVFIEETDITDLANAIDETDNADIRRVYTNLMNGSENHLTAFTGRIDSIGDVNGDGRFDSSDLVLVMQAGEYEDGISGNSTFYEGDWNGDGDFDSSDIVLAFRTGNYVASAEATVDSDAVISAIDSFFAEDDSSRKRLV